MISVFNTAKGTHLNIRIHSLIFISIFLSGLSSPFAQTPTPGQSEAMRGSAAPGRVIDPITPPSPADEPAQQTVRTNLATSISNGASKIHFQLRQIKIINPVIFSEPELIKPFQDKIGQTITLVELQTLVNAMTERYHTAGYVLTQVVLPEQTITDGIVTLQVIGGYVDEIEVEGKVQPDIERLIRNHAEVIRHSVPLTLQTLERATLLINDIAGMQVNAILKPSKTKLGAADLILVVSQKQVSLNFTVNNFGSPYLGPLHYILTAEKNSALIPGDSLQLQTVTTGNRALNYAQIRHTGLIGYNGIRHQIMARYVKANPRSTLTPLNVRGNDQLLYGDLTFPLIRSREENLFLSGGLTLLDDTVTVLGTPLYQDRIRPIHATFNYNRLDSLLGINQIELTVSRGLDILGASSNTWISRPNGRSEFTKFNMMMSRYQKLSGNFSCLARLTGQFSYDPLLAVSQFSFGGNTLGRGYDPSEILGDKGIAGSFEIQYTLPKLHSSLQSAQYYIFYDAGRVWNIQPNPTSQNPSATSWGFGIRVAALGKIQIHAFLAQPLTRVVASQSTRHARAYCSVSVNF